MAETRPLPTNYWTQRKTREMSPSARHVGAFPWTNKHTNSCGVYQIDPAEIAFATGYDETTCRLHMKDLLVNQHILWDEETLEVFILDWFRYHKFNGIGKNILKRDLQRIESNYLRKEAIQAAVNNHILDPLKLGIELNQGLNTQTEQQQNLNLTSTEQQPVKEVTEETNYPQKPTKDASSPLTYPQGLTVDQRITLENEFTKKYGVEEVQKALDEFSGRLRKSDLDVVLEPIAWLSQTLENWVKVTKYGKEARSERLKNQSVVYR
jgi:hypothetical protein